MCYQPVISCNCQQGRKWTNIAKYSNVFEGVCFHPGESQHRSFYDSDIIMSASLNRESHGVHDRFWLYDLFIQGKYVYMSKFTHYYTVGRCLISKLN